MGARVFLLATLLLLCDVIPQVKAGLSITDTYALLNLLFTTSSYDKEARPALDQDDQMYINVTYMPVTIGDVSVCLSVTNPQGL